MAAAADEAIDVGAFLSRVNALNDANLDILYEGCVALKQEFGLDFDKTKNLVVALLSHDINCFDDDTDNLRSFMVSVMTCDTKADFIANQDFIKYSELGLYLAGNYRTLEHVRLLVEREIPKEYIDITPKAGLLQNLPLVWHIAHLGSCLGSWDEIRKIIRKGARAFDNYNLRNLSGTTALSWCVINKNEDISEDMINKGAREFDVTHDFKWSGGKIHKGTIFLDSIVKEQYAIANLMLKHGAKNFTVRTLSGTTVLTILGLKLENYFAPHKVTHCSAINLIRAIVNRMLSVKFDGVPYIGTDIRDIFSVLNKLKDSYSIPRTTCITLCLLALGIDVVDDSNVRCFRVRNTVYGMLKYFYAIRAGLIKQGIPEELRCKIVTEMLVNLFENKSTLSNCEGLYHVVKPLSGLFGAEHLSCRHLANKLYQLLTNKEGWFLLSYSGEPGVDLAYSNYIFSDKLNLAARFVEKYQENHLERLLEKPQQQVLQNYVFRKLVKCWGLEKLQKQDAKLLFKAAKLNYFDPKDKKSIAAAIKGKDKQEKLPAVAMKKPRLNQK